MEECSKANQPRKMEFGAGEGWQQHEAYETLIAFFDVETTVPSSSCGGGGGYFLLEFGAILVCPRRLVEVDSFSTLVRPSDLNAISSLRPLQWHYSRFRCFCPQFRGRCRQNLLDPPWEDMGWAQHLEV
ncbi:hypothetical protein HPP92_005722 [Vanilla planifolia]|uniref:Uncharacterized protein n=1 Tax=Vanilla planifolia TaxID=51239 RepID=A0A835RQ90_VANPL|nr:hypothetical protein HPP92_005722 [Vanilla planifolia]